MVTISCPNCNQSYEVDDDILGENVECAVCKNCFIAKKVAIPVDAFPFQYQGNYDEKNSKKKLIIATPVNSLSPQRQDDTQNADMLSDYNYFKKTQRYSAIAVAVLSVIFVCVVVVFGCILLNNNKTKKGEYGNSVGMTKLTKTEKREDAKSLYLLGMQFYKGDGKRQDYVEAAKSFRKAAEQGYAEAQNALGECYYGGEGVNKDDREAIKWFRMAAEQGLAEAQNSLAVCLYDGIGVEANHEDAIKWFRKAAEQGHAGAQTSLATAYLMGEGAHKDDGEAVKWFRKAAKQGNPQAQFALGALYIRGQGVSMDIQEGLKWYRKAADQGMKEAQDELDEFEQITKALSDSLNELQQLQESLEAASRYNQSGNRTQSRGGITGYGGYPTACTRCGGTGVVPSSFGLGGYERCPDCNGTGNEGAYERALRRNPYQ